MSFISALNKSRRMRWAGHVARRGIMRYAYEILVGKHEGKRPPETLGHRMEDIRMELGWKFVNWIHLVQKRDQWRVCVSTVINIWVP